MTDTNGNGAAAVAAEKPKGLITKLAEVMAAVERIAKRGRNDFHGYNYATEADIAEAIRAQLAERHVMLVPSVESIHREPVGEKGSALTTLTMTFTFIDGDSGEELKRAWCGAGTDKEDKGLYKAMTGGEKYFLLKTFLLPTGDDPEREEGGKGGQKGRAERRDFRGGVDRSEEAQMDRTRASVENAPYRDREATRQPDPQQESYKALMERRTALPKGVQHIVPLDEALLLMAPEEEDQRDKYITEIRAKVAELRLNASEKGDLMWQFAGNRKAHLDAKTLNIWFLKAMHAHVVLPEPQARPS